MNRSAEQHFFQLVNDSFVVDGAVGDEIQVQLDVFDLGSQLFVTGVHFLFEAVHRLFQ